MAAVLALGERAVLSHRSAAELWELLPVRQGVVDVTVPTTAGREKRKGIRVHRSPSLPRTAITDRRRIAVTSPARTLADLRPTLAAEQYRKALRQAEFLGLDLGPVPSDRTRSELERLLLRVCRRHGLPPPEVNAKIGPFTVDFLWCDRRLIVETDGYGSHSGRQAFEDDRARDLRLKLMGFEVVRFTHRQVTGDSAAVAAALGALLA
jgi:very-short-patch-repair endonuclease